MPSYIQIEGDPTQWWIAEPFPASQLTGQPLTVQVSAPVVGTLVLSGKPGSIAVFGSPSGQGPNDLDVPIPSIYVPTPSGISEGHVGYQLPASADLDSLSGQIAGSMHNGQSQIITLGGDASGGTLVLNGATLSFVVLCMQNPPAVGGATPHGPRRN
jgi:hypothetical protein